MKFNHMYAGVAKTGVDLSRTTEDVYTEVLPGSYDLVTGKVINKTSVSKFVKTGVIDVNEKIQSYKSECDIYSILERFINSMDQSLLSARPCSFADIVDLPNNINDFNDLMDKYWAGVAKTDKELGQALLNEKLTLSDINAIIERKIKETMIKEGAKNE